MNPQPTADDIEKIKDWSDVIFPCRYGKPGDLHWVRENWQLIGWGFEDGDMKIRFEAGGTLVCDEHIVNDDSGWLLSKVEQLESSGIIVQDPNDEERFIFTDKKQPFKPSIHMPKTAARIWEEVVSLRVERLQDITDSEAIAEGIEPINAIWYKNYNPHPYGGFVECDPKSSFQSLWEKINDEESWNSNPWVWVIETKTLSTTGKPLFKKLSEIETV